MSSRRGRLCRTSHSIPAGNVPIKGTFPDALATRKKTSRNKQGGRSLRPAAPLSDRETTNACFSAALNEEDFRKAAGTIPPEDPDQSEPGERSAPSFMLIQGNYSLWYQTKPNKAEPARCKRDNLIAASRRARHTCTSQTGIWRIGKRRNRQKTDEKQTKPSGGKQKRGSASLTMYIS